MDASTTAGSQLATAVPEVQTRATGRSEARATPRAKKALERSSRWTWIRMPPCRARARAMGVERDPGEMQASRMPRRWSSPAN